MASKVLELLMHPYEIVPMAKFLIAYKAATKLPSDPDLAFCYGILTQVSRSFSVVIQQLPNPLRDAICVFYLVLRGLDTVEDDMALPNSTKLPMLHVFYKKIYDRSFTMTDCGSGHYKNLMQEFNVVCRVFLGLEKGFQDVIADITHRMGDGMAKFIELEVVTVQDYDEYCHYVAGLVGIGLSNLFASSGLENESFHKVDDLANHMGLFLQKTNIIRDYLEDIMEEPRPRMFWPREIWSQFGKTLDDFKEPSNRVGALQCLNCMVTDALRHVLHCFTYMEMVKNPWCWRFCAIPQVMAIGTLAYCFNNGKVFEGVVKMRRGETALLFDSCRSIADLYRYFDVYLAMLQRKCEEVDGNDPTLPTTKRIVAQLRASCRKGLALHKPIQSTSMLAAWWDVPLLTVAATYFYLACIFPKDSGVPADDWRRSLDLQQLDYAGVKVHQAVASILLLATFLYTTTRTRT